MNGTASRGCVMKSLPGREALTGISPAGVLILDFQPPDLTSVVKATQSVVFCYGSASRLIQALKRFTF